ncbi:chromate transporter [Cuneatibacter sp. NSJ-177]|nr:chromate transporter [Cuneatibacter sp. NSJ-177]MCJ7834037.1 chromate transporter [Cuneatibacter sp. NSJ-177]
MIYLQLFYEFFKIGLFAIGGGLATLPFLQDFADRTGLITRGDIANMIAISESTPGPIGINSATYFGYQLGGVFGGITAVVGLVTPSIIIIVLISKILSKFKGNRYVDSVFYGLRPASTGLIAAAGFGVAEIALIGIDAFRASGLWMDLFRLKHLILAVFLFVLIKKTNRHPVVYIALSAVVGIVFHFAGV